MYVCISMCVCIYSYNNNDKRDMYLKEQGGDMGGFGGIKGERGRKMM